MPYVTETADETEKALFVYVKSTTLISSLKKKIEKFDMEIDYEDELPLKTSKYDYIFLFFDKDVDKDFFDTLHDVKSRLVLLTHERKLFEKFQRLTKTKKFSHIKVVNADSDDDNEDTVEKILWFMMSSSGERSLNIENLIKPQKKPHSKLPFKIEVTRRRGIVAAIVIFLFVEFFFLIPLTGSSYYLYKAGTALQDQNMAEAQKAINAGEPYLALTQQSFNISRPVLLFLFVALIPENIISIEDNAYRFIQTTIDASLNTKRLSSLILNTDKSQSEIDEAAQRLSQLKEQVDVLARTSGNIRDKINSNNPKLEDVRQKFEEASEYLETSQSLLGHFDTLLGSSERQDYIMFFYNNMEIRPGGGFIGSFAHVVFEDYTLKDFEVYDVYDADGQLKAHVEPPKAIRKHLGEVHWYLRDSNFTPDFEENVKTAEFFLDREIDLNDFDGAIGITTTALSYILEAFGDVYINDFDETINKDNFYLKAQAKSEQEFFPGSIQKKSYLSTVGRTILLKLEEADPARLGIGIKRALDEKHIVILNDDPEIQRDLDILRWSGKIVRPQCATSVSNCLINHVFPVDANLGVNKANYFVSKFINLKTQIKNDGEINNNLTITFENNSASDAFPGGTYKNYFQLYIPNDALIDFIEFNGEEIVSYDETKTGFFKIVGKLIEIPPRELGEMTVSYTLADTVQDGENAYQVVVQKQIGAFNSDFSFEISFPDNMFITDQNFTSLAKNNTVGYNSNLSIDRIFVIEFVKE